MNIRQDRDCNPRSPRLPVGRFVEAALALWVVALAGCGDDDMTLGPDPGPPGPEVQIVAGAGPDLLLDVLGVDSLWVEGDSLHLAVSYGGGCEEHDFSALAADAFAESEPPQLSVYLRHEDHDDPCDAIVSQRLAFGLAAVEALFKSHYGGTGPYFLSVSWPDWRDGGSVRTMPVLVGELGLGEPREDAAAEIMAMVLSGELTAPDPMYERIHADLEGVRALYSPWELPFSPPKEFGLVVLIFPEAVLEQAMRGEYRGWDSLNGILGLKEIRFSEYVPHVHLSFHRPWNPDVLVSLYSGLPGVEVSWAFRRGRGWSNALVHDPEPGVLTYLVFRGWGDCPAGCRFREYAYFESTGGEVRLVGIWNTEDETEQPDWWEEARANWDRWGGR